jgi:hypothetical protein
VAAQPAVAALLEDAGDPRGMFVGLVPLDEHGAAPLRPRSRLQAVVARFGGATARGVCLPGFDPWDNEAFSVKLPRGSNS